MENKTLRERITLGILIAAFATVAYAAEHGAESGTGFSTHDRASACSEAKRNADLNVKLRHFEATVTGHSACDCSASGSSSWTCTVDAYWETK